MTGRKRRKVVFDQEDDSPSDGESVSVDGSDIDASSHDEEEGADGKVVGLKLLAKTRQKKRKKKMEKDKEADSSGDHSAMNVSGLLDPEAIEDNTNVDFDEDYHDIVSEGDQASEDGSGGLVDEEAVDDSRHLEFEEDFEGEDSEEEEDSEEDSTGEDIGTSGSDVDESDNESDDESDEFDSFVVEDDDVVYASEDDGLDLLDQAAETVSWKKRGAHFLEDDSMEGEENGQGSSHTVDTSRTGKPKGTDKVECHLPHKNAGGKATKTPHSQQGDLKPSLQSGKGKRGAHFMDPTDSSSDNSAAEDGMNESKEDDSEDSISQSISEESDSEMDEGEEGSRFEEKEVEKNEGNGIVEESSVSEDQMDAVPGALRWKSDLRTKAASSFISRQQKKIDLQKLVYDPQYLQPHKNTDENTEEIGGLFIPRVPSADIRHMPDVTCQAQVVAHDWSREDLIASMKDLMVTGRWGEDEDAQTLLQKDQELYGDFEDLEKGEKYSATERRGGGADSDDGEEPKNLLEKKRRLKEEFDKEYDDKEGGEKDYFSELKEIYSRQAELNRQEFEGVDESLRLQMEGARVGSYIRMETRGMPCEFIDNLDPHRPIIVGGLLPGETSLGYVTVRIKRHRWYKRILKSSDPLILSLGWRRFQTLPVYFKREDNLRQRYLKYTPEHLHCNATLYGPLTAPGTGFIGIQTTTESGVSVGTI